MSGTSGRPDQQRDSGATTRKPIFKSVGRAHQLAAFVFLGMSVLAFALSYLLGLIHLPE